MLSTQTNASAGVGVIATHHAVAMKQEKPSADKTTKGRNQSSSLFGFKVLLFLINISALGIFVLLMTAYGAQYLYHGPITQLRKSYERHNFPEENDMGFSPSLDNEITYYNRQCFGSQDISTQSNDDLMVPAWTDVNGTRTMSTSKFQEHVQDTAMTHGALLIPRVLSKNIAQRLRDYLETKYHSISLLDVPWSANFWSEMDRLSLGLTMEPKTNPEDEILIEALQEVGNNEVVKASLEALLGPNPAIVEISTLTTMHKAKTQGIHTDSDYFGSSLLYSRSFLHSYTMFMALQDTTPKMGATTVCPGTHMCANQDLSKLCDSRYAFEASSNGHTGKTTGLFQQGDAFLFNQNVWHRGPKNDDPDHPDTNRVMFIMTFVSRREYENYRDVRQLGWGTYYYMRWDQWGHTFDDLKHAQERLTTSWWNFRRALGLTFDFEQMKKSLVGSYFWSEHFARQLATKEDFYARRELKGFHKHLKGLGMPTWLLGRSESKDWNLYFRQTLQNIVVFLSAVEYKALGVVIVLYAVLFLMSASKSSSSTKSRPSSSPKLRSAIAIAMLWLILGHALIASTGYLIYQAATKSYLGHKIASGRILDTPFPDLSETEEWSIPKKATLPTTLPERMDVLIGSRFDAKFLGSYNNFLDYHPGNKYWKILVKKFSQFYPLELAQQGIQQAWQDQPIKGVLPRMLLQDYATGNWGALSEDATISMTRKYIRAHQSRVVDGLWTHLKEVLANSRFGHLRSSHGLRAATKSFVLEWENAIFKDIIDNNEATKMAEKKTFQEQRQPLSRAFVPFQGFKMSSLETAAETVSISRRRHLQHEAPHRMSTDIVVLQEGDRVVTKYPKKAKFLEAIISHIDKEEGNCLVQFVHDRSVAIKTANMLQPYRPLTEGDWVEGRSEGQWYPGRIEHVSPFGVYNVEWIGEDEVEVDVPRGNIRMTREDWRPVRLLPPLSPRGDFVVGQNVYVNHHNEGEWFPGRIKKIDSTNGTRTYSIRYDDGEKESGVQPNSMVPMYMP